MTPKSGISISGAGVPIPQFLTSAAGIKNKRNSYQPFRSTEVSTTLGAASTIVIDNSATPQPLLTMNEKLSKQKEA